MLPNPQSDLTVQQLRASARNFRAAAERNRAYPETYTSYIKLAEAFEQAAKEREARRDDGSC
jgi:hypothetical protein